LLWRELVPMRSVKISWVQSSPQNCIDVKAGKNYCMIPHYPSPHFSKGFASNELQCLGNNWYRAVAHCTFFFGILLLKPHLFGTENGGPGFGTNHVQVRVSIQRYWYYECAYQRRNDVRLPLGKADCIST
jgi:hypothetical protein